MGLLVQVSRRWSTVGVEFVRCGAHELRRIIFCLKTPTPNPNIIKTLNSVQKQIRLAHYWQYDDSDADDDEGYNPKIYLRSEWKPPWVTEGNVEARMLKFSDKLEEASDWIVKRVEKKRKLTSTPDECYSSNKK